jgi:hypothetical protein
MGSYPFMWEEAGGEQVLRYRNLDCNFKSPRPSPRPEEPDHGNHERPQ